MSGSRHSQPSALIPKYNEEGNLLVTTREIIDRLRTQPWSFEIIVMDDGSTDGMVDMVAMLARMDCRVLSFVADTNMGETRAFLPRVELPHSITTVEAQYVHRPSGTTSSASPGAIVRAVRYLAAFWWSLRRDGGERAER